MRAPIPVETIASWIGVTLPGPSATMVSGVAELHTATEKDLSLYAHSRWRKAARSTQAAVVICTIEMASDIPSTSIALLTTDPMNAWGKILRGLFPAPVIAPPETGCHQTAIIDDTAYVDATACIGAFVTVEKGARIGPGVVIAAGAHIGRDVSIGAQTTVMHRACILDRTRVGKNCWIGPNAVIGSYGFGIDQFGRKPHIGSVVIGHRVTIGAQTCIDRATLGETRVGDDCHIDNLVQIGHNVDIGKGVVICGQAGIAGSAKVGDGVVIGGQAGIADHAYVASGIRLAAQSGVTRSLEEPGDYSGHPAEPNRGRLRREIRLRKLAES